MAPHLATARGLCADRDRRVAAGVYDRHKYDDEKREALELWAAKLRSIVAPSPRSDNVVPLRVA